MKKMILLCALVLLAASPALADGPDLDINLDDAKVKINKCAMDNIHCNAACYEDYIGDDGVENTNLINLTSYEFCVISCVQKRQACWLLNQRRNVREFQRSTS